MDAKAADDRFYTPRNSARRGYPSGGSSEDERFASPREHARSVSSDDNEYATPRESLAMPSAESLRPVVATAHSSKYLADAFRGSQQFPSVADVKQALPESTDTRAYEQKAQQGAKAKDRYLSLTTGGGGGSATELRGVQYAEAPVVPENDIFSAARHNRVDSVTYMLDQGVSVNSKDEFGNTILSIACQNGLKRMAKLAMRRGVNINSKNLRGNTALHFCFAYGYGDTLGAYLISKGADATIENKDGNVCYYGIDQQQQPVSART